MKNAKWIERQLKKAERLAERKPRKAMKILALVKAELATQEMKNLAEIRSIDLPAEIEERLTK